MIRLEGIWKRFGSHEVLRGLDLEVRGGETLVLLGRSGCGKSVTLRIILGLLRPDAGRVWIDGTDVTDFDERRWVEVRKRMGMVFQASALFDSLTVRDNVAYFLEEHTDLTEEEIDRIVAERLEFVGLAGAEHLMPAQLSGGMRKRVALARAMAANPEILLYDEPTTGLDPITARTINQLIRKTQEEFRVTSIVVTHELESAFAVADRVAVMDGGRILFVGTVEEVKACSDPFVQDFLMGPSWQGEGRHTR
ncbi:MAG: ABC transporter ATP-binding protein [candidate division KSB1 bacterium]|nr:ABC transporter ATP-binding protein [candidate division KSB1 bacterium]